MNGKGHCIKYSIKYGIKKHFLTLTSYLLFNLFFIVSYSDLIHIEEVYEKKTLKRDCFRNGTVVMSLTRDNRFQSCGIRTVNQNTYAK